MCVVFHINRAAPFVSRLVSAVAEGRKHEKNGNNSSGRGADRKAQGDSVAQPGTQRRIVLNNALNTLQPWYVLSCLWDGAYKRTVAANRKE